jgi:hypothetical protein
VNVLLRCKVGVIHGCLPCCSLRLVVKHHRGIFHVVSACGFRSLRLNVEVVRQSGRDSGDLHPFEVTLLKQRVMLPFVKGV